MAAGRARAAGGRRRGHRDLRAHRPHRRAQRRPRDAHKKRNGEWIDLQLPLYRHLARALALTGEPELGYAWVGKDEDETGFFVERWAESELAEALEVARDVVRRVRAGEFRIPGRLPYDEILRAIHGQSTLGAALEEAGE